MFWIGLRKNFSVYFFFQMKTFVREWIVHFFVLNNFNLTIWKLITKLLWYRWTSNGSRESQIIWLYFKGVYLQNIISNAGKLSYSANWKFGNEGLFLLLFNIRRVGAV